MQVLVKIKYEDRKIRAMQIRAMQQRALRFENQIAVVTGASSGLGQETAILMAREGAELIITGRKESALKATLQAIKKVRKEAELPERDDLWLCADLAVADERMQMLKQINDYLQQRESGERQGLDVLVNSAGLIGTGSVESVDLADFRAMFEVNVFAVLEIMQGLIPALKKAKGAVVNISSISGLKSFPGLVSYCSSKGALNQITQCASLDLAPSGVRVNAICPGVVVTELHKRGGMDEEAYAQFLEHCKTTHPLGRVGESGDVAELIAFLASSQSAWITGVTMPIDGGRHLTCAR